MTNDLLESSVKRHYQNCSLSLEKLQRLQAMADIQNPDESRNNKFWQLRHRLVLVASFVFILISGVQFFYIQKAPEGDLLLRVAQEVELNHSKQLASDYSSDNYTQLAGLMSKLEFELKEPALIPVKGYQLIGARYCSIQGQIAAQLKLENLQGEKITLFATRVNDELATLHNKNQLRKGMLVRSWKEGSVFFSLVSPQ